MEVFMEIHKNLPGKCFENGYKATQNKGTAIIGMSPGNSYFKEQIIHDLIAFAAKEFTKVIIWTPDIPATHTYMALGYPPILAARKARQKGNGLKNHSARVVQAVNEEYLSTDFQIMDWNHDIEHVAQYREQLAYINALYKNNREFYEDVRAETAKVIEGYSQKKQVVTEAVLDEGSQYLLKEIAFFCACESILQSNNITLLYHRRWPVFEKFFSGHYDGTQRDIGLLIVTPPANN